MLPTGRGREGEGVGGGGLADANVGGPLDPDTYALASATDPDRGACRTDGVLASSRRHANNPRRGTPTDGRCPVGYLSVTCPPLRPNRRRLDGTSVEVFDLMWENGGMAFGPVQGCCFWAVMWTGGGGCRRKVAKFWGTMSGEWGEMG